MKYFALLGLCLTVFTQAAQTQLTGAQLAWNPAVQLDTIHIFKGFQDSVPNLGRTKPEDAVKITSYCYEGDVSRVCAEIKAEANRQFKAYAKEGLHQGLRFGSCEVQTQEHQSTVVARYEILDDYVQNFEVERTIKRCR